MLCKICMSDHKGMGYTRKVHIGEGHGHWKLANRNSASHGPKYRGTSLTTGQLAQEQWTCMLIKYYLRSQGV